VNEINAKKIIPNPKLSKPVVLLHWGNTNLRGYLKQLEIIGEKFGFKITDAIRKIPENAMEMIFEWRKRKIHD
jgi:excinuclease ABC subunit A